MGLHRQAWSLTELRCTATPQDHEREVISVLALSDDRLASGSSDKTVRAWDLAEEDRLTV